MKKFLTLLLSLAGSAAENAVRMGEPEKALRAVLMQNRTNPYLTNGHNYQTDIG